MVKYLIKSVSFSSSRLIVYIILQDTEFDIAVRASFHVPMANVRSTRHA